MSAVTAGSEAAGPGEVSLFKRPARQVRYDTRREHRRLHLIQQDTGCRVVRRCRPHDSSDLIGFPEEESR